MIRNLIVTTVLVLLIIGCGKEFDYRDQYIGTYLCTKSNTSFDSNMVSDPFEVVITINPIQDSVILLDGVPLILKDDGTTGGVYVENNFYDLDIDGNKLLLLTYPVVPGTAISCYIKGEKQ